MSKILITGSKGFIGKNLRVALKRYSSVEIVTFDSNNSLNELDAMVNDADLIFHLAGVNRPNDKLEFIQGNIGLTKRLCESMANSGKTIPLVLYGQSKYKAEKIIIDLNSHTGTPVYIFRLPNVFGKWCRPNYNSVVATFCHNIARGLPVTINNRNTLITFVYIDDVIKAFMNIVDRDSHGTRQLFFGVESTYRINLGDLHDLIMEFEQSRFQGLLPDMKDPLVKYLYSTYASYRDPNKLAYLAGLKVDNRGWLFELIRSSGGGQVFVSLTKPGVTRGNHYHDSKVEKVCVISGEAIIRLRSILCGDVTEYGVNGTDIQIVDIPPGFTHSIENIGNTDLITLFWANEVYDSLCPDTWLEDVMLLHSDVNV